VVLDYVGWGWGALGWQPLLVGAGCDPLVV